jgi:signal transduction histidine kinase
VAPRSPSPARAGGSGWGQRARRLAALNEAALAIAGDLDLNRVLEKILKTAARLVGARYGALGIPDGRGGFGRFLTVGISEQRADRIGALPRAHGVLGALVSKGKPIRSRDIRRHPDFSWYPEHHPEMVEFLGVPIRHRDAVLGNLFFSGARGGVFTAEDQKLVEMLAAHAGVAIATAQLYADAQRLATLEERSRVARELHDAVSQTLFSLVLEARAAADHVQTDPQASAAHLTQVQQRAAGALEEMRNLVQALQPRSLERDGLAETLRDHVDGLRQIHQAAIEARIDEVDRLSPDEQLAVLRIAQEALHNAVKHAGAVPIHLDLRHAPDATRLVVRDEGPGFDVKTMARTRRTVGLHAMRDRAHGIGANLTIESRAGGGSVIRLTLPRRRRRST